MSTVFVSYCSLNRGQTRSAGQSPVRAARIQGTVIPNGGTVTHEEDGQVHSVPVRAFFVEGD